MRKITRILLKTLKYVAGIVLLLLVLVGIGINTYSFQTWLGQKAGAFLSDQLGVTVSVGKVNLDFIRSARLMDVYIEDQAHDTLFYGKTISINVSGFSLGHHRLNIDEVKLSDTKAHLIKHKNSNDFNFQFLVDYFSSKDTLTDSGAPLWTINYGQLFLDDIDFIYRNEKYDTSVSPNINFDNIHAAHVYGSISDVHIIHDSVYASVKGLRCREQSGITIEDLTVKTKVASTKLVCKDLHLKTTNSLVDGTFLLTYKTWSDYQDFIDKVKMDAWIEDSSKVSFTDIAYFAKELNGLDKTIYVRGNVSGYISDLKGTSMDVKFGESTRFRGNAVMKGLPDINRTYLHFDVDNLSTTKNDLAQLPQYPFHEKKKLPLPPNTGQLGTINYTGKFDGYINDFTSYGIFRTALGNVTTDLAIRIDTVKNIISYTGKVSSGQFNIGRLFGNKKLGNVSLDSRITGQGITLKEINATLNGNVNSITYNGYTYQNISLNGTFKNKIFKGDLVSKDKNADLDFNGSVDFTSKVPTMDFISTVNNLNLKYLGFLNTQDPGVLSSQILINLKGDNIDNLTGLINFDNTIYKTAEKQFKISTFDLVLEQSTADKKIKLGSNILDLTVNGRFLISNIEPAVRQFLSWYYPAFFAKPKGKTQYADALQYKLVIKKFNSIRDFFIPELMISPGTVFEGDFDATKKLFNLNFNSDSIRYSSVKFNNNRIESYSQNNKINLVFKSKSIQLTDSISIDNYFMYLVSKDENTKYNVEWNNNKTPKNAGRFAGKFKFDNKQATMTYDDIFVTVRDSTWKMTTSNPTVIDSSGAITVNPLLFVKDKQVIDIHGALTGKPSDQLSFSLSNFDLEQLAPFLPSSVKVDGNVSGNLALHNNLKKLAFSSDLVFTALKLNNNVLGDGELKTEYNSADKYVYLDGYTSVGMLNLMGEKVKNISFSGYYYPDKKENSLDITFSAQPANLRLLNPIVKGLMTFNTALVNGEGTIKGSMDNPLINGKFNIVKCDVKVDFTNVTYSLLGSVEVMPDQIRFDDITLNDNMTKNKIPGTVSGNIFHENFKNMRIDFDINYNNMLVLNTFPAEGVSFYGKVFASGSMGIYGLLDNVKLEITTKTEKGTVFNIPLDGPAEVADNGFIRFVTKDTVRKRAEEKKSGFSLDMNLKATPDAEVQIIFDAKSGDVIKARGGGDLDLKINNLGKFDMYGEYELTGGDYLFTLENFITKKFEIDKGSLIKWSGSPSKAEINVAAVYKQRTSIAPLFPLDTTGTYKRRYPVDCKLYMKDKLMSPDISFGIELPTIDENTRSKIKAIMLDETELNRQVFSLLLLKSFVTPLQYSSAGGISAGKTLLAANSSEMLSNRLSSWLNGLTKQVDIGVNYRPGGTTSSDELDIALSKQLLNNRLSVDGNLGVNNNQNKSTNGNGLIGDVNVEYKLTDDGRYRVKGFNRSNDNTQITTTGGPFTQGVGVFYREEFETWPDLYRRYLKKLKGGKTKNDPQQQSDPSQRTPEATDPDKAGN